MSLRESLQRALVRTVASGAAAADFARTGVFFDPLGPAFMADPYPTYQKLRERSPMHRMQAIGGYLFTRYDHVLELLRDRRLSADERTSRNFERNRERRIKRGLIDADQPFTPSMLRMDDPDHARLRRLVTRAFTPQAVTKLAPRVHTIVREHLDALEGNAHPDLMRDFANTIPVIVIAEMLGILSEDRVRFKRWSDDIVATLGAATEEDVRRSVAAGKELTEYLGGIAELRRREPRDDLISALLLAEEEGDKLSLDEVYGTVALLLIAGNETTTNLIGNGLLALLEHPEQLANLQEHPNLIESAIEETLRFDPPVQATSRFVQEEFEFSGTTIKKGREVLLFLAAANRDPATFPEPERFDIERCDAPHLAFSNGAHFCLGAALARLEAQAAIGGLVERFPQLAPDGAPKRNDNLILRGLERLPVTL